MTDWTHPEPERLSAYLEGELPDEEEGRVRRHLEGCARCEAVLRDLREVVRRAGSLEDREPERDLWPAVARVVESEARGGGGRGRAAGPASRRAFALTLPQAAAAALVLIALSAATAWVIHPDDTGTAPVATRAPAGPDAVPVDAVEGAPEGYADELAELETSLRRNRARLEPNTVRVLEKNLEIIDRAIRESRRALEVDPGNPFLEQHLERTYRTKLEYLRQASSVAEWSS